MRKYRDVRGDPSLPPGIAFVLGAIGADGARCEWDRLMPFQQRNLASDIRQILLDRLQF